MTGGFQEFASTNVTLVFGLGLSHTRCFLIVDFLQRTPACAGKSQTVKAEVEADLADRTWKAYERELKESAFLAVFLRIVSFFPVESQEGRNLTVDTGHQC